MKTNGQNLKCDRPKGARAVREAHALRAYRLRRMLRTRYANAYRQ